MKKPLNDSRKGDLAEFYAVTWLWDSGYEVFLNPASTGPIDLICYKNGECTLVDVKTSNKDYRDGRWFAHASRTQKQKEMGVRLLCFHPETRKLTWVKHKDLA
jgi:Holliday junction resolvase-like predicted endonuclease